MRKWASDWLDLPVHVASDAPRIEIIGSMTMQVENYQEIEKFNADELLLKTKTGILKIEGKQLKIKAIQPEVVWVEGKIQGFQFQE
ncbi:MULTISPECIES: YabP/YqfC family sporulation protein [Thermoactinomyces]|jgi:sporulation protein YqfC|uniref:Sporulation protein YqfC n=1 Tax=Thermoactinomyces vulgaris TaxID=2026 RepID=A0ABS0QGN6_THEVU|nr:MULTISPECIES: YabP/YqfC family sporulation protein [Thermoactinomyces]KFZ40784.1 hypothetical protein JS81_05035 [Thermoactinomyces sp. Gus2-1]KYQ86842.1 hypothetical protein AYX07_06780 [Thermoactinomyces sp. AS95]MBA4550622.1 sporulation protein YqfC [Thermoactinomyces vulgaris]MBA4596319.1 sporulation protein YqfC [Thermoactinomyces vulgaris]MBH8582950.1 sporulation protein YqfC [Thermoactinomyces sp. CICC 10735]